VSTNFGNPDVLSPAEIASLMLLADTLRRGGDRSIVRHIELERDCVRPNLFGRNFAALKIARTNQHGEAMLDEFLCKLKTDSLVCPCDQCDRFLLHIASLVTCGVGYRIPS
jgi:hypothetical protein